MYLFISLLIVLSKIAFSLIVEHIVSHWKPIRAFAIFIVTKNEGTEFHCITIWSGNKSHSAGGRELSFNYFGYLHSLHLYWVFATVFCSYSIFLFSRILLCTCVTMWMLNNRRKRMTRLEFMSSIAESPLENSKVKFHSNMTSEVKLFFFR